MGILGFRVGRAHHPAQVDQNSELHPVGHVLRDIQGGDLQVEGVRQITFEVLGSVARVT